jgi:hypothetical protein
VNVNLLAAARKIVKSGKTTRGKPVDFVITPAVVKKVRVCRGRVCRGRGRSCERRLCCALTSVRARAYCVAAG